MLNLLFKSSDRKKKEASSLIEESNKHALEAMRRYEYEMDSKSDHAIDIFKLRKEKTRARMISAINGIKFCGFEAEGKVKKFQENEMQKIFREEWEGLQHDMRSLTSKMYESQMGLKNDFENIILNLKSNTKKIRVPQPKEQFSDLEKIVRASQNGSQIGQIVCFAAASAGALLLLPSSAVAAQGTGIITVAQGSGNVIAHGTAHGTGQIAAHGTAQIFGVVIPGLNILLATYSLYCIGKFFFDDSEVRKDLISHIDKSLDSVYGTAINGSLEECGLYGQFQNVKTQFREAIRRLYEESIQPVVDVINWSFDD